MKVIIAGGRDYHLTEQDRETLDSLLSPHCHPAPIILCGMARGADTGAREWALSRGLTVEEFPARWDELGKSAGPIRNQAMVDRADGLVVFPGGTGTKDVTNRAMAKGIMIWRVVDDGHLELWVKQLGWISTEWPVATRA